MTANLNLPPVYRLPKLPVSATHTHDNDRNTDVGISKSDIISRKDER